MTPLPIETTPLHSASLRKRLLCMLYEAMLLLGVLFIATWAFSTLFQQRHALYLRDALQDWLFVVLGMYFCWIWTHGGQTLPMKTWNIRLVDRHDLPITWKRALARYALCWLWFLPGMAVARFLGAQGWMMLTLPAINFVLWAAASRLHPDHQFLHYHWAGTRLVTVQGLNKTNVEESIASSAE